MRSRLSRKLFLALLVTTASAVGAMLLLLSWSFNQGFVEYLNRSDHERLVEVAQKLEAWYAQNGSWQSLAGRPWAWEELTRGNDGPPPRGGERMRQPPPPPPFGWGGGPPRPFGEGAGDYRPGPWGEPPPRNEPPPPPRPGGGNPLGLGPRLALFDADRQRIAGRTDFHPGLTLRPLESAGATVGWLGLEPLREPAAEGDVAFLRSQRQALYAIAALVLGLAAVAALVLARQLLGPLQALTRGARELTQGRYGVRVPIRGRDELARLAEDFNRLAQTLEANESARRRWVADISHELRTPLAVLRGEVEALQDGVREANPAALASLHGEVLHLGKLVDDLYQLALSDLGALSYHKQLLNPVELMVDTAAACRHRFGEKGLTLALPEPAHTDVRVFADPDRLTQLFNNLLQNSLRYTDPGGTVRLSWAVQDHKVHLDFSDSAPGVDDGALARLFERLYRGDGSRQRAKGGAGLGLAIAQAIVAAHEGSIEAHHAREGGLWVRVSLPVEAARGGSEP